MKIYLSILISCLSFLSFSQSRYVVRDTISGEPMPFVKVIPNTGTPQFTDIDGKFDINEGVTSIQLRFQGYRDTTVLVTNVKDATIYMWVNQQVIQEVVAIAGENPAHRIMDLVIENRKKNHPLENDAFTYNSYSKFIFDIDSSFQQKITTEPVTDSTKDIVNFVNSQHLFMLESASERTFIPPARDRENITAYKVSGISHPAFSTFAQSMQSFNFYDNQFDLFGSSYVNPIAFGGTKRYLFLLEDTTVVGMDTTFTISYRPRLGKTFNGLKGKLFINTNGYAVEKVIAEPFADTNQLFNVKIVQEYEFINGQKWFPVNLSTAVELKGMSFSINGSTGFVEGTGHTYIKDIKINPDGLKKRGFNNIALATDIGAENVKENEWNGMRNDSLTDKEARTYVVIDSLAEAENFDKKLGALMALSSGKIRMGPVNLLLDRIIDFNMYEGYRLGAGLETSDLLMKNISVGGYFAYGFRDKEWKYGGFSTFHLNRRQGIKLTLRYQQDVLFRGGNVFERQAFSLASTEAYARIYRSEMERQRLAELQFSISPLGNLTFHAFANYQRVEMTKGYQYTPMDTNMLSLNQIDLAETSIEMRWNIREKVILLGEQRVSKGTKYPKISLKITKGWSGIAESTSDYTRLNLRISEDFSSLRFGAINVTVQGSQTIGDVPLFLKQNAFGTRQDWNVTTANTFETVYPGEFYHDRQAVLFVRYDIPAIRTKMSWNEPQFIIHHGIGYGDFKDRAEHNVNFSSMDKGLFEAGLILSGLLKVNFTSLGVGLFYRYGVYSEPQVAKNLVPKISLKVSL